MKHIVLLATLLNGFMNAHQKEFVDLNAQLQKASQETQEGYAAHMAQLTKEVAKNAATAHAFELAQQKKAQAQKTIKK